jgi:hypothetical protein
VLCFKVVVVFISGERAENGAVTRRLYVYIFSKGEEAVFDREEARN